jgi:7-cyano-7-deazaguanine synthase
MVDANRKVIVLVSGGIDSAACIYYYLQGNFAVESLHVNYGQLSATKEADAVRAVTLAAGIPLHTISAASFPAMTGEIRGRNAFLLMAALMAFPEHSGLFALGIHAGTGYADCSPAFVAAAQAVFDVYADGRVRIDAPFLTWSKGDVYSYFSSRGDIRMTYSCELGRLQPCDACRSCADLRSLGC